MSPFLSDSLSQYGCCRSSENNEVMKLKLELLKYKLETAKVSNDCTKVLLHNII